LLQKSYNESIEKGKTPPVWGAPKGEKEMKLVQTNAINDGNRVRNDLGFIMSMRFWIKKFEDANDRLIYTTIWVGKHNPSIAGDLPQSTFSIYYTKADLHSRRISYKGIIIKEGFKTSRIAMEYVNSHLDEILSLEFEEKII